MESEGRRHAVRHLGGEPGGVVRLEIDGLVVEAAVDLARHRVEVAYRGQSFLIGRPDAFGPAAAAHVGDGSVSAPMPGTVLEVSVSAGQEVSAGDRFGAMEAMKMELSLKAPIDGVVTQVGCGAGDRVALGATLFLVEALGDSQT